MADLRGLAEQYGCVTVHQHHDATHTYVFQADRKMHRYRIGDVTPAAS